MTDISVPILGACHCGLLVDLQHRTMIDPSISPRCPEKIFNLCNEHSFHHYSGLCRPPYLRLPPKISQHYYQVVYLCQLSMMIGTTYHSRRSLSSIARKELEELDKQGICTLFNVGHLCSIWSPPNGEWRPGGDYSRLYLVHYLQTVVLPSPWISSRQVVHRIHEL